MAGKTIGDRSIARLGKAVRSFEKGAKAPGRSGGTPSQYNTILARITGNDGGAAAARKYSWEQVRIASDGTYEAAGLTGTTTKGYAVMPSGGYAATGQVLDLKRVAKNNGDGTFVAAWVIVSTTPQCLLLHGRTTRPGIYTAYLVTPATPTVTTGTSSLTGGDFGTTDTAYGLVYFLNAPERGQDTFSLDPPTDTAYCPDAVLHAVASEDGKPVYRGIAVIIKPCTTS